MKTGLLVNVRDVESLRDGMLKFAQMDVTERQKMGVEARLKAEREFDERHIIEAYNKVLLNY